MSVENQVLPIPEELNGVPPSVLENYVLARVKQFARTFASHLSPNSSDEAVDFAFSRACLTLRAPKDFSDLSLSLKFRHRCRFLGCQNKNCKLCKNNPYKICEDEDLFDEYYADQQVLRSKCQAEISVELNPSGFGSLQQYAGLELQMSLIDGDSYGHGMPIELLKTEDGRPILSSRKAADLHVDGRLYLPLKKGSARLPDLFVTIPCDNLMLSGTYIKSLRLLVRVVRRNQDGIVMAVGQIREVVSGKFVVKPQAVIDGCRTTEYPYYNDDITKLRYIGREEAQILRSLDQHMAPLPNNSPAPCISTVDQLKHLMIFLEANPAYETQLKAILNMNGRNQPRWDYIKQVLWDRVVYEDVFPRAWYADENMSTGLVFPCKQGQVDLDRPIGILQRVTLGNMARFEVEPLTDDIEQRSQVSMWRMTAEAAWRNPFHPGWHILSDQIEWNLNQGRRSRVSASSYTSMGSTDLVQRSMSMQPSSSASALLDPIQQMLGVQRSNSMRRHSISPQPSGHSTPHGSTPPGTPPGLGGLGSAHNYLVDRVAQASQGALAGSSMMGSGGGVHPGQRNIVTVTPGPTVSIVGHPGGSRSTIISGNNSSPPRGNSPFLLGESSGPTFNRQISSGSSGGQMMPMAFGQDNSGLPLSRRLSQTYSGGGGGGLASMMPGGVQPPAGISNLAAVADYNMRQQQGSGSETPPSLKRGRLPNVLPAHPLALPRDPDGPTLEEMVQAALRSAQNDEEELPTRSASRTQLYHSESHGRHTPRTRMPYMDSVSPGVSTPQNSLSPTISAHLDGGMPSPSGTDGMRRSNADYIADAQSHMLMPPPGGLPSSLTSRRRSAEFTADGPGHMQHMGLGGSGGGGSMPSTNAALLQQLQQQQQQQQHSPQAQHLDGLEMPTEDFFTHLNRGDNAELSEDLQRQLNLRERMQNNGITIQPAVNPMMDPDHVTEQLQMQMGPPSGKEPPFKSDSFRSQGFGSEYSFRNDSFRNSGKEPPFKSDSFRSQGGGSEYSFRNDSFRNDSFRNLVGSIISPMSPDRNDLDNELDFLLPQQEDNGTVGVTFGK